MDDLKVLLAAAMVGTSRAPLPAHAGTPLAGALNSVERDDPAVGLLARAALAGLATRAGRRPEPAPPLPDPAPAEALPEAPPRVTRHLSAVLNTALLPEWLTLCAAAGWRVPHAHLPDLLDWGGRVGAELRDTLRPVLGERGRWLAALSPNWRWFRSLETGNAELDEEAWDAATEAVRESLFRALRAADPASARDFLNARFRAEKAGVRRRLLDALAQTWQPQDAELEPLLAEALADRSEDVRAQSRRLLQRLPGSAYNARMVARVAAMLGQEKVGLLGKLRGQRRYTLTLPDAPDADARRDGLEAVKRPAERLRQLLSATHPGELSTALGLTPAELVELAAQFEGVDELVQATLAVGAGPNEPTVSELAELLLPRLKGQMTAWRAALLALVSAERRDAELRTALRTQDSALVRDLLGDVPAPWPRDLSGEVLRQLGRAIRRAESQYASSGQNPEWNYAWHDVLELAATRAAPDAPRPAPLPPESPDYARQTLDTLYATLNLRARMHADFAARDQA